MNSCKECNTLFESEKSLHSHLRKHKLKKGEYYKKHYPKTCLHTGKSLPFKDSDTLQIYMSRDFINEEAMYFYFLESKDNKENKIQLLSNILLKTKEKSDITPCQFELSSSSYCPDILLYSRYFDYDTKCKELSFKDRFDYSFFYKNKLPISQISVDDFCIAVDTREQSEYNFFSSIKTKLDVGDYAIAGKEYNSIHLERKSTSDAGGTFSKVTKEIDNPSRFEREMQRVRESGKYLIILVESSIMDFKKYRFYGFAQADFILNRMRYISRTFSDCSQVVFGGNRNQCQSLVPMFLLLGEKVKTLDLQLWVDLNYQNIPKIFSKQDLLNLYARK